MADKHKSRKFIINLLIVILASILCTLDKISGAQWIISIGIVSGVYSTTNVAQKTLLERKEEKHE